MSRPSKPCDAKSAVRRDEPAEHTARRYGGARGI